LRWLVKVPCLIETQVPRPPSGDDEYKYYNESITIYSPIGMKIWMFLLIVLVSLIPILNILVLIVCTVWFFIYRDGEDIPWSKVFPKGPGRIASFLNKKL